MFEVLTGQPTPAQQTGQAAANAAIQSLAAGGGYGGGSPQADAAQGNNKWDNLRGPGAFAPDGTPIPNIGGGIRG
jgi:hypothetical protein